MWILRDLGIRRAFREFFWVLLSKLTSPKLVLRWLFGIHKRIEDSIDYLSILNAPDTVHPKHRLTGYHRYFIDRIKSGERVLDIGCGNGAVAYDIAVTTGALVTGIDRDEKSILAGRKKWKHDHLRFLIGDATHLSFQDYDVIILSNVLEHICERVKFLREIIEKVRPKRILLRVPVYERHWHVKMKEELGLDNRLDPTHYTEYTRETFIEEMGQAGLRIVGQDFRWSEIWAELKVREH